MPMAFTRGLSNWSTGTASVTNGSRTVTFTGASLISTDPSDGTTQIYVAGEGDMFIVDNVGAVPIKSVDGAGQVTLDYPWAAASQTGVAYRIRRYNPPKTGEIAKYIDAAQRIGQDTNPFFSATIDNAVVRGKLRGSPDGKVELAVGPAGAADGALKAALSIDPATGVASHPAGVLAGATGLRNRIINGGFDVWQRGTTVSVPSGAFAYAADRWFVSHTAGVTGTFSKVAAPTGFRGQSALNFSATGAAAGSTVVFYYRMEGRQVADLDTVACTLSFDVNASTSAGTLTGGVTTVMNSGLDNGSYSTNQVGTSFTVPIGSGRIVVPLTAAQMMGARNGMQLVIVFTQTGASGNPNISIGSAQHEAGPVAQPFEFRAYATELALCQRYFYRGLPPLRGVVASATLASRCAARHPVQMRAVPTVTFGATVNIFDASVFAPITSIGTNLSTTDVLELELTASGGGLTALRPAIIGQGSSGYLDVSAELF